MTGCIPSAASHLSWSLCKGWLWACTTQPSKLLLFFWRRPRCPHASGQSWFSSTRIWCAIRTKSSAEPNSSEHCVLTCPTMSGLPCHWTSSPLPCTSESVKFNGTLAATGSLPTRRMSWQQGFPTRPWTRSTSCVVSQKQKSRSLWTLIPCFSWRWSSSHPMIDQQ